MPASSSGISGRSPPEIDPLSAFLRETSGEDWREGWSECACWALRWVAVRRGEHVLAWLKRRWLVEHVGIVGLAALAAEEVGLAETVEPGRGDVGVVTTPGGTVAAGIATRPGRWALRARRRVVFAEGRLIMGWRVG